MPPVESVEVSTKHFGIRSVLFIIAFLVAVAGISLGIYFMVRTESGWQLVTPRSSAKTNCSSEFSFYYYVDGRSSANKKELTAAQNKYTELCVTAYELFTPDESISGTNNVYYINRHANEEIVVDERLYNAFASVVASRFIYGAPVQSLYEALCDADEDWRAAEYDPAKTDAVRVYYNSILSFARDANHVSVELLGDNKIILHVSEEYQAFAAANGIVNFIDFAYYKNAFIIDYMVDELRSAGLTNGLLISYDGYTRTLSTQNCSFDIYASVSGKLYNSGLAKMTSNFASISLRSFIGSQMDKRLHYQYADGTYAHCYFDMDDGIGKCSTVGFTVYSSAKKCADLLQYIYPIWIADTFDATALSSYKDDFVYYVYSDGADAHYSDANLSIEMRDDVEGIEFKAIKD